MTIRDPVSSIASIISFTTKKKIMELNPEYQISNPYDLVKVTKLVESHISNYMNFYKKVLRDINTKGFENLIIIDYSHSIARKLVKYKYSNYNIKKSSLHTSMRNKKRLQHLLNKNFDMTHVKKLYKKIKKIKKI